MTITQDGPDHRLKASIEEELAWTPAINAAHIGVAVDGGAVALSGDVASYPEKEAAVRATLRTRGVLAIADEISVHTRWAAGARDDIDIAREAVATLNCSVVIPTGNVQATVHDGEVTLTGEVERQSQREATEHAVAVLPGVVLVHNEVSLTPAVPMVPTPEARQEIAAALTRNALLNAERVHIEVAGTAVTLTGTVSSWAQRRQADQAAWSAPGVTAVDNLLDVTN